MTPQPSIDRLRLNFRDQLGGAASQALFALLLAVVAGGAYLARLGTDWARALTGGAIAGAILWQVVLLSWTSRRWKSPRLALTRVLVATDARITDRALRALTLVERTEVDDSVGSHELASLHLTRLLDRVSNDSVRTAALRQAQRARGLAVALLSCAALSVFLDPARVVEGLDVLAARHGRAPLTMSWLRYARVGAQPPSYTRESEHTLVFGTSVALPKGTVITIRGVPRAPDRELVATDGTTFVPFASDGSGGVVARYTVRSSASLRVAARFGDVRIDDDDTLEVMMVADARPSVELEGAPRTIKLVEAESIVVRWTAIDDHGLREVDLVLRSGAREDRRVLGRFDGEDKVERGGQVLPVRDAFLRRMFLPVTLRVEAKDNDPMDGPKWAESRAITIEPPEVGEPEAARYVAVRALRDQVVDLLGYRHRARDESAAERRKEVTERVAALVADAEKALDRTYAGATLSRGMKAFLDAQLDRLRAGRGDVSERAVEDSVLAIDVALRSLGNRDAAEVAKRLAEVAEEAALGAKYARETEHKADGMARLDVALVAVEKGAGHLSALSSLGKDLGSVATADAGRVRRARDASDLFHAELAALHLAARLGRPTPSFGATTGSGRKGGVESGHGRGREEGSGPSPSSAEEDFDRASSALDGLIREHDDALRGVESALERASHGEPSEAEQARARELANKLRDAAEPLPLPGQGFGTPRASAALAREHAIAAAHGLENLLLEESKENADSALGSLDQAEQRLEADDAVRDSFPALRGALREAAEFANRALERRRAESEAKAKGALDQAAGAEGELSERAQRLSSGDEKKKFSPPRERTEELERASSVMKEAAQELAAGHGERGAELQREAQGLLEKARLGHTGDPDETPQRDPHATRSEESDRKGDGGDAIALGGPVPGPDDRARAEEFRRRVLMGLGRERGERLSPAIKRYTEELLK